jgi:5-(carboxyamino)imidazole ribonucleotide mutase
MRDLGTEFMNAPSEMTHEDVLRVKLGIIMGSQSDWPTMREAASILDELGVAYETRIVSAHRTPDRLWDYGKTAADRGLKVIIAGAGGAAHLPGMMASKTRVPVIGVPVQTKALSGVDSLYSIVQMPRGYPVATMAIGAAGAANAGSWPPRSSPPTIPRWPNGSMPGAPRCRPPSPRHQAMTDPLPSGAPSASSAAGNWAGCCRWRPPASATAPTSTNPARPPPPMSPPRGRKRPTTTSTR